MCVDRQCVFPRLSIVDCYTGGRLGLSLSHITPAHSSLLLFFFSLFTEHLPSLPSTVDTDASIRKKKTLFVSSSGTRRHCIDNETRFWILDGSLLSLFLSVVDRTEHNCCNVLYKQVHVVLQIDPPINHSAHGGCAAGHAFLYSAQGIIPLGQPRFCYGCGHTRH